MNYIELIYKENTYQLTKPHKLSCLSRSVAIMTFAV